MAMQGMTNGRRVTSRPPERPPQAPSINMMDPAIQAEIARQVALALGRERSETSERVKGARLITFPG
jgi:hypothetical protein